MRTYFHFTSSCTPHRAPMPQSFFVDVTLIGTVLTFLIMMTTKNVGCQATQLMVITVSCPHILFPWNLCLVSHLHRDLHAQFSSNLSLNFMFRGIKHLRYQFYLPKSSFPFGRVRLWPAAWLWPRDIPSPNFGILVATFLCLILWLMHPTCSSVVYHPILVEHILQEPSEKRWIGIKFLRVNFLKCLFSNLNW